MVKTRKQINADHYAKRKAFVGRRKTRNNTSLSQTPQAIAKRRCRQTIHDPSFATLASHGFQVFPKAWTLSDNKNVCNYVRKYIKEAKPMTGLELRSDPHRLAYPITYFHERAKNTAIKVTKELGLEGEIVEKNIVCIVVSNGSVKQADHADTYEEGGLSVLHILTNRTLWIGDSLYRLNARDVLVLQSGKCHAGAKYTKSKPSMLIHVPIGYDTKFTYTCK